MPQIAIVLPYAVTIRDFVHAGTLEELLRIPGAELSIYTQNVDLPELAELHAMPRVRIMPLSLHRPSALERFVRHLYPLLFYDKFVYVQKVLRGRRWRERIAALIAGTRRLVGTGRTLRWVGRLLLLSASKPPRPYLAGTPDLVIGTRSLVNSLDFPVICEAVHRKIPLITAVSSWDNFTTKGYLPFPVRRTVVWNRKMADELVELFEVDRAEIVEAGYPRVRLLHDTGPHRDAASYLAAIGLPQYRRFVLYSASYAELTRARPEEPPREYLLIHKVCEALAPTLPADTCILVRFHPYSRAEEQAVFDGIDRVQLFVPGRIDRYVERVMSRADEHHLAAQLQFAVCLISMASTMTIDALAVDCPVINVAFEPDGQGDSIRKFYEYNHFADVLRIVRPPVANQLDEVLAFVRRCLAGDRRSGADMAAFAAQYVPSCSRDYPRRLRETIETVLSEPAEVRRR